MIALKDGLLRAAFFVVGRVPPAWRDGLRASPLQGAYLATMRRLSSGSVEGLYTIQGGPLRGRRIVVHPSDYERRYLLGTHEPDLVQALIDICRPGDTVLDIGAHYGYFTILQADLVGPTGRVFACEPLPANAARVRRAVKANGLETVDVLEVAVGARDQETTFVLSESDMMGRVADHVAAPPAARTIAVQQRSVDSLLAELAPARVDVIKLDVEGAEDEAVTGMSATLARYRPALLIEVHTFEPPATHARPFVTRLTALGYEVLDVASRARIDPASFDGGHVLAVVRESG